MFFALSRKAIGNTSPPIIPRKQAPMKKRSFPAGYCFAYCSNGRCGKAKCSFIHLCPTCKGDHAMSQCTRQHLAFSAPQVTNTGPRHPALTAPKRKIPQNCAGSMASSKCSRSSLRTSCLGCYEEPVLNITTEAFSGRSRTKPKLDRRDRKQPQLECDSKLEHPQGLEFPILVDVPNPPCMVTPKRHPPTMRETTPEKIRKVESTDTAESQDDVPEPETPRKQKLKAANRRLRTKVCQLAKKTSRQRKLWMTKEEAVTAISQFVSEDFGTGGRTRYVANLAGVFIQYLKNFNLISS
ncbi:hypothetical protein LSAT2_019871 [Lamellibrachia satsuma]|nr:hypothetical protein LSAT2_019871 [Lamellibrachia satsuma]